ncbi:MAG: hypothetical protein U5M50_13990 [Sphingobium sp.]|nr:hypothetical protein [Sphingobium sp.]
MASVDGQWDTVTKTPMGDQQGIFTVVSSGDSFTGSQSSPLGTLEVQNGKVDGNRLTWTMEMSVPFPMTLEGSATVDGDSISGEIQLGSFGVAHMSGKRVG